jgi:hypothetical protein
VNTVFLRYNAGSNFDEIQMIKTGSHYEAVIPKQTDGTKVTCSVHAVDYEEFTSEQEF